MRKKEIKKETDVKKLIKLVFLRMTLFFVILGGGFYLGTLSQEKPESPWRVVEENIRTSVRAELMANPEFDNLLTPEQMDKFMDCTMEKQMSFLENSGCHPRAANLQQCLDRKDFKGQIDKVNQECMVAVTGKSKPTQ